MFLKSVPFFSPYGGGFVKEMLILYCGYALEKQSQEATLIFNSLLLYIGPSLDINDAVRGSKSFLFKFAITWKFIVFPLKLGGSH